MATLLPDDLAALRREAAAELPTVSYTKATINSALQAIEDWFETNRPALMAAIETAAPGAFPNPVKRLLIRRWLQHKFRAGN